MVDTRTAIPPVAIPSARTDRLPAIDGLRGLAILMVTGFHMWWSGGKPSLPLFGIDLGPLPQHGAAGVSLFFAISGFCLFYPVAQKRRLAVGNFFARRAVRILPAYYLAVAIWFVIWGVRQGWMGWPTHLFSHLSFTHTLSESTVWSINGGFWSLGTEVHFYLAFPLLALLALGRPLWFAISSTMFSVAFYLLAVRVTGLVPHVLANLCLPYRLCEFAWGMYAAHLLATMPPVRAVLWGAGALGVANIALSPYLRNMVATSWWYAPLHKPIMSVGWGALILAVVWAPTRFARACECLALRWCGLVSFSMYLYNPLLSFAPLVAGSLPWYVVGLAFVVAAGGAGYWLVEAPFLNLRSRLRAAASKAKAAQTIPAQPSDKG